MGQIVKALIEHKLTPEQILELPILSQNLSSNSISGQWGWTVPQIDKTVLLKLWAKKAEYFINNSWDKEDLALLEKDRLSLHFFRPNLASFDNSLNWSAYNVNKNLQIHFNDSAKKIANILKAIDILIVPDLADDFIDKYEPLTVDIFRQKTIGHKELGL